MKNHDSKWRLPKSTAITAITSAAAFSPVDKACHKW